MVKIEIKNKDISGLKYRYENNVSKILNNGDITIHQLISNKKIFEKIFF